MANLANRFSLCLSVQFDGEKPDKITRDACACNDDKVIFENPLNWSTRSFIFAKQRESKMGLPLRSPVAKLSCEAATEENAKRRSFMPRTQVTGKANFSPGITSGLPVIRPKPAVSARIGYYIVRTARNRVVPSTTR